MNNNKAPQFTLKVFSVFMIFGGTIRLLAERRIFESFLIGELWSSHPYFIYIYRVLGAFVIFAGIVVFMIARAPLRYKQLLKACSLCFIFIACVMFLGGLLLRMSLLHYAFDVTFCIILAWLCFVLSKNNSRIPPDGK
ncbi:MAG: hypothetical protein JSV98_01070 [candidate division WOR-3 bacterium]|nr:MAG: hypothetical protein JSV98_01070 [candidate division WOR-3 bacterium]